jgi:hypothetical protein
VAVTAETEEQRREREQQRLLFDGVAGLYDATRQGYPGEIVSTIVSTAVIGPLPWRSAAAQANSPGSWPAGRST